MGSRTMVLGPRGSWRAPCRVRSGPLSGSGVATAVPRARRGPGRRFARLPDMWRDARRAAHVLLLLSSPS
jgi:hypothetical protein